MSYCLNPVCPLPQNTDDAEFCSCGAKLRLNDRYMALQSIGQGGFGRTFLAVDLAQSTKPRCVIKQFFPNLGIDRSKASELFREEAERLKQLGEHPQIPNLLDYLEQDEQQYLIQEFVDGQNLEQELIDRGAFSESEIGELLRDLLPVLQFMHDRQVIHRDIKPANIIRRAIDRKLVLVDLGAAKYATGTALAKTGTVIGSAEYTAPEQARGRAVFASDIYSLGATCIHLLTQMSPFDLFDTSDDRWAWRDCLKHPVSQRLDRILHKMLESGTNRRYQTATQVLADLNSITQLDPNIAASVEDKPTQSSSSDQLFNRRPELISIYEPETRSWRWQTVDSETDAFSTRPNLEFEQGGQILSADSAGELFEPFNLNQKAWLGRSYKFWLSAALAVCVGLPLAATWQTRDRSIRTIKTQGSVESLAITPDGQTIASSIQGDIFADEKTAARIELWNLQTGESIEEWNVRPEIQHDPSSSAYWTMNDIAITPDGKTLVGGGFGGNVRVWNLQTGTLIGDGSLPQSVTPEDIAEISLSRDGRSLATSSAFGSIKLWSLPTLPVPTLPPPRIIQAANQGGRGFAISPDGNTIALAGDYQNPGIHLQDLLTGKRRQTLQPDPTLDRFTSLFPVYSAIAYSPDGRLLVGITDDARAIDVWNLQTGTRAFQLEGSSSRRLGISPIAISPDSRILASSSGNLIQLWNLETGKQIRTFRGHRGDVNAIAFTPDGKLLISGDNQGEIKIWSLP